jgi:hypothetical protein
MTLAKLPAPTEAAAGEQLAQRIHAALAAAGAGDAP